MRIATSMIYSQAVTGMNDSLSDIMRLNEQNASQKQVNRPSDDPAGMARAIDLRSYQSSLEQYEENIGTAEGWLSLADDELSQASDIVTSIEELAEQAATGTLDDDQRDIVADEMRQLLEELIAVSNTTYAGDSIFAGSEIDDNAYEMGLAGTVTDDTLDDSFVTAVTGESDSTIAVEFVDSGTIGTDNVRYRYSDDGGDTWTEKTLTAPDTELDFGNAKAQLNSGDAVTATPTQGTGEGTYIRIRPAVIYQGDDSNGSSVHHYGTSPVTATSEGDFETDIAIRVDTAGTLTTAVEYSYSLDNGATWVSGNSTSDGIFTVPGGYVELANNGGTNVDAGDQFIVEPYQAEMYLDIGPTSSVQINNVGTDIFGGLVEPVGGGDLQLSDPDSPETNLFETVGELIGFLETNDQEGVGESIERLNTAHEQLTTQAGIIGGREVRVQYAEAAITSGQLATTGHISSIEDADISQITTDLARAEYTYQAVLQTSANIMQLSLLNYI